MILLQDWKCGTGTVNYVHGECGRWDSYSLNPKYGHNWEDFTKELRERLGGQVLFSTRFLPIKNHDQKLGLNLQRQLQDFNAMKKAGWIEGIKYPGNHCGMGTGYYLQLMILILKPAVLEMLDNLSAKEEANVEKV